MCRLIIFFIQTGVSKRSCSIVALSVSGISVRSRPICISTSGVMFFSPILRSACVRSRINIPLNAKFLGAPCLNMTVRLPNVSFLLEPVVRKFVVIGTCVEKPNRLAAVVPEGIITALSRLAISVANSNAEGYNMPNRVLRALTYTPLAIRTMRCSFSKVANSLVTYSSSDLGNEDTKNTLPNLLWDIVRLILSITECCI